MALLVSCLYTTNRLEKLNHKSPSKLFLVVSGVVLGELKNSLLCYHTTAARFLVCPSNTHISISAHSAVQGAPHTDHCSRD